MIKVVALGALSLSAYDALACSATHQCPNGQTITCTGDVNCASGRGTVSCDGGGSTASCE